MLHSSRQHRKCRCPQNKIHQCPFLLYAWTNRCNQGHNGRCFTTGGNFASAAVPIARHINTLVHCVRGLTVTSKNITSSWCIAGGRIAGTTVPRARQTNCNCSLYPQTDRCNRRRPNSWCFTTGGSNAGATVPRQHRWCHRPRARHISALFVP